ncbi:DUF1656 domain-containing protein [Azotobacter bryophylli]|uniref:DUF1656 domain-containing protein n=1 Tax=Azotobacter bryophylli TaxID=1986537 RepID=A0ABV7ARE7_9GAMM
MPREIAIGGVYMPSLTLLFLLTLAGAWVIDRLLAWYGFYRNAWHPTMLRASLFVCIYGALALYIYH